MAGTEDMYDFIDVFTSFFTIWYDFYTPVNKQDKIIH